MHRLLNTLLFLHPYMIALLVALMALFAFTGCSASGANSAARTRKFATTATTTAVGAYIGAKEGDGRAEKAAVGAAAGFVVGEVINHFTDKAQREAYLAGHAVGQSDAIKQQYWIARDNQRAAWDDGYEEAYYEIPVPQTDREGVRREPTTRVIRVVVPKEDPLS